MAATNTMRFGAIIILAATLAAAPAAAQTAMGEHRDLRFEVVNATSGQPGAVQRLTLDYMATRPNRVLDVQPDGSAFTLAAVPVSDIGTYLITAWSGGVPYWWQMRGNELAAGPVTLHVFDVVAGKEGVSIAGMTVVARRRETVLELEYMLRVTNEASPQVTVMGRPATFEMALPAGAADIVAEYQRGPEPTPIPVQTAGEGRLSLEAPLTPGGNVVRVTAMAPWSENLELPLLADLPVLSWSLLTSPVGVTAEAFELEDSGTDAVPGYMRYVGPPLDAGRRFTVRLSSGAGPAEEPQAAFSQDGAETGSGDAPQTAGEGGGFPLPLVFAALGIIIVIIAAVRRRSR